MKREDIVEAAREAIANCAPDPDKPYGYTEAQAALAALEALGLLVASEDQIVEAVAQALMCDQTNDSSPCEIGYMVTARLTAMLAASPIQDGEG